MNRKQYIRLNELPIKAVFNQNGYVWKKKSKRTPQLVDPKEFNKTWFYFRATELCIVGEHSRLHENYFN